VLALIHERFFVYAEQRFHVVAFFIEISTATSVPAGCFLSQTAITSV
jgi:hypothetical protein